MSAKQYKSQFAGSSNLVQDPVASHASPTRQPLRRTFRLSEIPPHMDRSALRQRLNLLKVGAGPIQDNSKIHSLASYKHWRVATVSFDQEPDEFNECQTRHDIYLKLPELQDKTGRLPILIVINCDFSGMTPLYEPDGGAPAAYDLIAVTGLSAHAFGSWKAPDQYDKMWLRDFLPIHFPDIRVFTWGYYSSLENTETKTSLDAISRNFLVDIKSVREKETANRPVILIGHSLGGLVLQRALVEAKNGDSAPDKAFHQSCIGMLFFGVPILGLNKESIQAMVQGKENKRFLQDISAGSDYLFDLEKRFRNCHETMKTPMIVCFYEGVDTPIVEKTSDGQCRRCGPAIRMVRRESSICYISKPEHRLEINADHSKMVKFRSQSDTHYRRVIEMMKEMTKVDAVRGFQERLQDNELRQIIPLMSLLQPEKRHHDIRQKRVQDTGKWFLCLPEFEKWRAYQSQDVEISSVLVCSGSPGAGKSVICSLVFDHITEIFLSEERTCVTALYCNFQDNKQTAGNMVGALLNQVIARLNKSGLLPPDTVATLRQHLAKDKHLDLGGVCRLLGETAKQLRKFYVCIDALDECSKEPREDFIRALASIASEFRHPRLMRIFFTAQLNVEWMELMKRNPGLGPVDNTLLEAHREDIAKYICHKMYNDKKKECMNYGLQGSILKEIIVNLTGIFILPALQLQIVLDQTTIEKRGNALRAMPTKLDEAFASKLENIKGQQSQKSDQAMEVLKWILLAQRPLTVMELLHALSIPVDGRITEPGHISLADNQTFNWENLSSEKSLIDCCLGLVIIDEATSTVRLMHKSLHDYLMRLYNNGKIFQNGHIEIAYTCLQYMCFNDDQNKTDSNQTKVNDDIKVLRLARFCFLEYAISNFGNHLRVGDEKAADMIHAFFPDEINRNRISTGFRSTFLSPFDARYRYTDSDRHEYLPESQIHLRLQFAISCGLQNVFTALLDASGQTIDYDTKLGGSTMLLQASRVGSEKIVGMLLENRVNVNLADGNGQTALSLASENGYDSVVELLLKAADTDINWGDNDGCTALSRASKNGHIDVVNRLLRASNIDINSKDRYGRTALSQASKNGHIEVVKLLLKADRVHVNSKDRYGRTALSRASDNRHTSTATLLIQAGAIGDC